MEKGNSRNSSSVKSASDSKSKQDVTNKFLRLPRYKDSVSPRPDSRSKPNPQRNRELSDKRPKNKTGIVCKKYRSEIVLDDAYEQCCKSGYKKANLNHLLNFTLTPFESKDIRWAAHNRSKLPKYNKELFLQANCQFVVREEGNYEVHLKNPDILVEWSMIEEILLPSYEAPLCPICLYPPVAAKITRCGHVYCWPCMLHYLALTDRTWQKCPICFDAVHKSELRSVSLKLSTSFIVGNEIAMQLMKKEKDSLLPIPASNFPLIVLCNVEDSDTVTRFQKILLANDSQMSGIIKRENTELLGVLEKEKDTPESCFIEEALKLLEEREGKFKNGLSQPVEKLSEPVYEESHMHISEPITVTSKKSLPRRQHTVSQSSVDTHGSSHDEACDNDTVCSSASPNSNSMQFDSISRKDNSYFYQAENGQHIFLHNINVRMIVKEYGSLENAPEFIKANIIEIDRLSMTEVLRKKFRYLKHLPLTCEFQVVELNLAPILSKATIQQFEDEILKRKHSRNRKARDERRREKYIEQEENKKLGKYPGATYNLRSVDHFPTYDPYTDFQPLELQSPVSNCTKGQIDVINDEMGSLSFVECSDERESENAHTTSFAQMLKDGQAKSYVPKQSKIKIDETVVQRGVVNDNEDWIPPPEYHQSFSDAIQVAIDSAMLQKNTLAESQKSSKKKKTKNKLLFTTSMCRNK